MSVAISSTQIPSAQQHLYAYWNRLSDTQKHLLQRQIQSIDFQLLDQLQKRPDHDVDWRAIASRAKPPEAIRLNALKNRHSKEEAIRKGIEILGLGQVGAILVAGGQGSRLGFDHPKGMYPIGPISKRTLFQFHIDQIRALRKKYRVSIPLYVMTSPATHDETVQYFTANQWFGLPQDDLRIFRQGTMPAVDQHTGQIVMSDVDRIELSPDGHGGTLSSLENSGCLDDIIERRIQHLFYFQVDNPLVEICDPELIGYHALSESDMTTQVVAKQHPMEKVGNVAVVDGIMMMIEYSDLPEDCATRCDKNDNAVFWAGNIAVHVFSVDFLRNAADSADSLPFHRALKKVPYLDQDGTIVSPEEPNAIKFEKFIFDLMPLASNPIVVEADAKKVFAPLKNASGAPADTPEASRAAILAKHKCILRDAGITVEDGVNVEINPMFALSTEDFSARLGTRLITSDRYLSA